MRPADAQRYGDGSNEDKELAIACSRAIAVQIHLLCTTCYCRLPCSAHISSVWCRVRCLASSLFSFNHHCMAVSCPALVAPGLSQDDVSFVYQVILRSLRASVISEALEAGVSRYSTPVRPAVAMKAIMELEIISPLRTTRASDKLHKSAWWSHGI